MIGDILRIRDEHRKAARGALELLLPRILSSEGKFALSIGGESGSGKSEIAAVLAEDLQVRGLTSVIFQQDDYFELPPKSNDERRRRDLRFVGPSEVRLELLDRNIREALAGESAIVKPLVHYKENHITEESLPVGDARVLIAEGTYTTLLSSVHARIFIDRTNADTRSDRVARGREAPDAWQERVLAIEHDIISGHKDRADVIITRDFDAVKNTPTG